MERNKRNDIIAQSEGLLTPQIETALIQSNVDILTQLRNPHDLIVVNSRAWPAARGMARLLHDSRVKNKVAVPPILHIGLGYAMYRKFLKETHKDSDEVALEGWMSSGTSSEFEAWLSMQPADSAIPTVFRDIHNTFQTTDTSPAHVLIIDDAQNIFEDPGTDMLESALKASAQGNGNGIEIVTHVYPLFGEDDTWQGRLLLHTFDPALTDEEIDYILDDVGTTNEPMLESTPSNPVLIYKLQLLSKRRYGRDLDPVDLQNLRQIDTMTSQILGNATELLSNTILSRAGII